MGYVVTLTTLRAIPRTLTLVSRNSYVERCLGDANKTACDRELNFAVLVAENVVFGRRCSLCGVHGFWARGSVVLAGVQNKFLQQTWFRS